MIDSRVKFRHLQTFVEVARQKSVMRAAEILHVSQPAVTKTIRELEEALGVAVFERDGRGIKSHRLGEVFLRPCRRGGHGAAAGRRFRPPGRRRRPAADPHRRAADRFGADHAARHEPVPEARRPAAAIKIVTGENAVLLEQLRVGELDLVVGRLAAPEKMTGFSFEHLYSEQVVFVVRAGHPLLDAGQNVFARLGDYPVLMPTRGSIIRPFVERFFIANGMPALPTEIETVSDSFGRAFVRQSDAIWIISAGVVAGDIVERRLRRLPIDTERDQGAGRPDDAHRHRCRRRPSILMQTIREAASHHA